MRKKIVLYVLMGLCFSCGQQRRDVAANVNDDNSVSVRINVPGPQDLIDPTPYVDSVKLVLLETTEESLISSITELFFTDQWIIVVESKSSSILFFDYAGKYSHKISRRGRGPGEYLGISGTGVNSDEKRVMVYDFSQRRLNKYDFEGNLVEAIENFSDGMLFRDILCLPDGSFLCYRQDVIPNPDKSNEKQQYGGVWKVSPDGAFEKYIYEIREVYPFVFSASKYHLYSLPDNEVGFVDQNLTDVYHIKNDSVYRRVEFVLPGKTAADLTGIKNRNTDENYFMIYSSAEKGGYIFTDWSADDNSSFMTVFSKHDSSVQTGLIFHPFMGDYFIPGGSNIRNNSNNIHSSWFSPFGLVLYRDNAAVPEMVHNIAKNILGDMTIEQVENSNPVLQLLYIKN